jgi:phosphate:Na+ symporter
MSTDFRPDSHDRSSSKRKLILALIAILILAGMTGVSRWGTAQSNDPIEPVAVEDLDNALNEGAALESNEEPPVETTDDDSDPADDEADTRPEYPEDGTRTTIELIPDVRALFGTPDTTIDLEKAIAGTDLNDGRSYFIEVAENTKDKYADVEILDGGKHLRIHWKKPGKTNVMLRLIDLESGDKYDARFEAESWEPDYVWMILTVLGGLGLFLLGMKNMSEGLQTVAGSGLRRMISIATEHRLMATGVGLMVTTLVQSSSITTVMVVGFVNSGFMTLSQAIGVILGANIGTTITGWILALKIGHYGLPLAGAAVFFFLFSKKDKVRFFAMAAMGLGLVFFGLDLMKDGFSILKDLPQFDQWFAMFSADTYFGVLKCAAVGCILTLIVQSSSATLGITISLAATGVIGFETAAALVLGENVGTTITALLASIDTSTNARRAAFFHAIFNLFGVIWVTAIFLPYYLPLIIRIAYGDADINPEDTTRGIALTHTIFNVSNVIIFLPFTKVFARLLERYIPEREAKPQEPHLTHLNMRMFESSAIAIEHSRIEVVKMAKSSSDLNRRVRRIIEESLDDDRAVSKAFHQEEILDGMQDEIIAFIADLLAANVSHDLAEEARCQLRIADELESISDYLITILKSHLKLAHDSLSFSEKESEKLFGLHDMITKYLDRIVENIDSRHPETMAYANSEGRTITLHIKDMRDQFLERIAEDRPNPKVIVAYNTQLNAYRRVREHVLNAAQALSGEK